MDYLTKYYKNLSEQLQEKVNNLQKLLNEDEDYKDILRARPHARGVKSPVATHDKIVDSIVNRYKGDSFKFSGEQIRRILNNHPDAPFLDPEKAIETLQDQIDGGE